MSGLGPLLTASFCVHLSNAAITTMIGVVFAQDGKSQSDVAAVAATYSLGFLVGCFLAPSYAQRTGIIRSFAASTAVLTISIIGFDLAAGTVAWGTLRFVMGASMATVLAIADSWINDTTPNERRGSVIAVYSIVLGLAALVSQFVFLWIGVGEDFVLVFAIAMNVAVVVVALAPTAPPALQPRPRRAFSFGAVGSMASGVGAFSSGFMSASFVSVVPFHLVEHGVSVRMTVVVLSVLYLGRLVLQWPVGWMSDRMDRRSVLAGLSLVVAAIMVFSLVIGAGEGRAVSGRGGTSLQVAAFVAWFLLGGTLFPIYSIASALAFDRAEGRSVIDISTTLLAIHSVGAVAGPSTVMLASYVVENSALASCMLIAAGATMAASLFKRITMEAPEAQAIVVGLETTSSVEMAHAAAEVVEELVAAHEATGVLSADEARE